MKAKLRLIYEVDFDREQGGALDNIFEERSLGIIEGISLESRVSFEEKFSNKLFKTFGAHAEITNWEYEWVVEK